jgi:hypothetical protein
MRYPSKWFLSLRFSHWKPVYTYPVSHTFYMLSQSQYPWFDNPKNIWWGVQIIMFSVKLTILLHVLLSTLIMLFNGCSSS